MSEQSELDDHFGDGDMMEETLMHDHQALSGMVALCDALNESVMDMLDYMPLAATSADALEFGHSYWRFVIVAMKYYFSATQ